MSMLSRGRWLWRVRCSMQPQQLTGCVWRSGRRQCTLVDYRRKHGTVSCALFVVVVGLYTVSVLDICRIHRLFWPAAGPTCQP